MLAAAPGADQQLSPDPLQGPHWVIVTDCDEDFVYLHDPDVDHSQHRQPMDCQHLPVSHDEFDKMCSFGSNKLRAAVVLSSRRPT